MALWTCRETGGSVPMTGREAWSLRGVLLEMVLGMRLWDGCLSVFDVVRLTCEATSCYISARSYGLQ